MMRSTILPWMISRTKKRLSRTNRFVIPAYVLALCGMCFTCAFVIQAVRQNPAYGVVYGQIPVMHVPIMDNIQKESQEFDYTIERQTAVIVFTLDSFVFGHLSSFTEKFYRADNKFRVDHVDGAPHLGKLMEKFSSWQDQINPKFDASKKQPVILYPVAEMPMEKVIQVMDLLQKSTLFDHVVLATGLL